MNGEQMVSKLVGNSLAKASRKEGEKATASDSMLLIDCIGCSMHPSFPMCLLFADTFAIWYELGITPKENNWPEPFERDGSFVNVQPYAR